jgi:hypothetical protein
MKERALSLPSSPFISSPRKLVRLFAVGLLCLGTCGSLTARADNAKPAAKVYEVAMTFRTAFRTASAPRVRVHADEKFNVILDYQGTDMMASFVLTASGADAVKLNGTVECGHTTAHPALLTRLGEAAIVKLHEGGAPGCELTLLVSEAAMPAQ